MLWRQPASLSIRLNDLELYCEPRSLWTINPGCLSNGLFATDEQLRELVKEQALSYKDARDYQVTRDRMRQDGRAFDKGQYEAMRSAVCAYDPEQDESRVGLSQLNTQIGLITAPPESKAHLKGSDE